MTTALTPGRPAALLRGHRPHAALARLSDLTLYYNGMLLRRHCSWRPRAARRPARPCPGPRPKTKVVATFSILGDLLAEVGGRSGIELAVAGRRRHRRPRLPAHAPADARALAAAQALVSNGLGFEGWIDRLAKAAPFKGSAIVATAGVADPGRPRTGAQATATAMAPTRIAGRTSSRVRHLCRQHRRGPGRWSIRRTPPIYRERAAGLRPSAWSTLDHWVKDGDRQGAGRQAARHHGARFVPLFLGRPMACSSQPPRGYNTEQRAVGASDVAALIRQVREQAHQGAVRREHDQPRPGRPDRARVGRGGRAARSTAMRCRDRTDRRRPTRR